MEGQGRRVESLGVEGWDKRGAAIGNGPDQGNGGGDLAEVWEHARKAVERRQRGA